jgi:uncharacterized membrane protein
VLLGLFALGFIVFAIRGAAPSGSSQAYTDVTALRVAISWHHRAFVQRELQRIARTANTATREGRAQMLRDTCMTLRRSWTAWLSAAIANQQPTTSNYDAENVFRKISDDAKFKFQQEIVRNQHGALSEMDATPQIALTEEGEGFVVVTLVVAAHGTLDDYEGVPSYEHVRAWLEAMSQFNTHRLMAVDIVWSPAAEDDRLSSAELAVLYPELSRINPGAVAGRVTCSFCSGPYPAELVTCPHCGARAAS